MPRSSAKKVAGDGKRTASSYREALRAGQWFARLPDGFQTALLEAGKVVEGRPGQVLFDLGDPPSGIYGVLEGSVRISAIDHPGAEALVTLVIPPMWFGEIAVFDAQGRTHSATVDRPSRLIHVPQGPLEEILRREPAYWQHLGRLLTSKLRMTLHWIEDGVVLPLSTRLVRRLLLMAGGYGEWQDRSGRTVAVRQEQLALMLSTSRQTINQELRKLEARGLIALGYGGIEIVDLAGLRSEALSPAR